MIIRNRMYKKNTFVFTQISGLHNQTPFGANTLLQTPFGATQTSNSPTLSTGQSWAVVDI